MRCFIAIDINDELKNRLKVLAHSLEQLNDRSLTIVKGGYHVTLSFLGELSIEKVEEIKQGLDKIDVGLFEIDIKDVGVFESNDRVRTIWVACHGVPRTLTHEIDKITGDHRQKPFSSHITIARVKSKPNDGLSKWLAEHKNTEIGRQLVRKIILKRSVLQSYGAVHQSLFEKYLT